MKPNCVMVLIVRLLHCPQTHVFADSSLQPVGSDGFTIHVLEEKNSSPPAELKLSLAHKENTPSLPCPSKKVKFFLQVLLQTNIYVDKCYLTFIRLWFQENKRSGM